MKAQTRVGRRHIPKVVWVLVGLLPAVLGLLAVGEAQHQVLVAGMKAGLSLIGAGGLVYRVARRGGVALAGTVLLGVVFWVLGALIAASAGCNCSDH